MSSHPEEQQQQNLETWAEDLVEAELRRRLSAGDQTIHALVEAELQRRREEDAERNRQLEQARRE